MDTEFQSFIVTLAPQAGDECAFLSEKGPGGASEALPVDVEEELITEDPFQSFPDCISAPLSSFSSTC